MSFQTLISPDEKNHVCEPAVRETVISVAVETSRAMMEQGDPEVVNEGFLEEVTERLRGRELVVSVSLKE